MSHQYDSLLAVGLFRLGSLVVAQDRPVELEIQRAPHERGLAYETPRNRPDRHCVTRLTTDFDTPSWPLRTSANVASMSRVDIPCTYHSSDQLIQFFRPTSHTHRRIFERKPGQMSLELKSGTWTVTAPSPVRTRCDSIPRYDGLSPSSERAPERSRSSLDSNASVTSDAPVRIEASSALPTERSPTDSYPRIPVVPQTA